MSDIKTTVDAMTKKDIVPDEPIVEAPHVEDIPATKIRAIAKELAQPWQYGEHLNRFARRHGVSLEAVIAIKKAIGEKAATFAPAEPVGIEGGK